MRFLREPLLHFLILGAAIFIVFNFVNKGENEQLDQIVVTAGQIQHLADTFSLTWQRPPTQQELEGLIQDYIREEVLYREATALGLDNNDSVIRRRLRQKMEFISEDVAAQAEATDEELQDYLLKNPAKFHSEPIFTFSQIYLSSDRRGDSLTSDIENLLAKLNKSGTKTDISALGDGLLLEHDFKSATESEINKLFGQKFASQLLQLEPGKWHGPVKSGYGVHLVFIKERSEGRVSPLDEVREAVQREWANERRLEMNERFYQGLLERYTVVIEQPENDSGAAAAETEASQ
jgi:parvulin-like peptidyl-prolyl isomerase